MQSWFVRDDGDNYRLTDVKPGGEGSKHVLLASMSFSIRHCIHACTPNACTRVLQVESWPYHKSDDDLPDLVQMLHAGHPNVLNLLRKRHTSGEPYTRVGMRGVLVSVNPFRQLDIYGTELMYTYYKASAVVQTSALSPHIFAVAGEALRSLRDDRTSQSVCCSTDTIAAMPSASVRLTITGAARRS